MGLGSRSASRHETVAASKTAGADPSAYWDFKPGQRVMTVDGFPGVVAQVEDGPHAGSEVYHVTLDDGMGGGQYTASQLSTSHETTASVHTAADDYPELAQILTERPDIAPNTFLAKKIAADLGIHDHSRPKGEHGIESFDELEPNDGAESGVDEHGHLTWDGASPGCRDTDEYSMFGQNDAVKQASHAPGTDPLNYSSCTSYRDNPTFCNWHKTDHLEPDGEPRRDVDGHLSPMSGHSVDIPKCDLCNGFHDSLDHYNQTETADHFQEPDPDDKDWTDEPGPHHASKQAAFYTVDELRAIGQDEEERLGMSAEEILRAQASGESWKDEYEPHELAGQCTLCHDPQEASTHSLGDHFDHQERNGRDAWGRPKMQAYDGHDAWSCNNGECAEHPQAMYDQPGLQGMPGWQQYDAHPDADLRRMVNQSMPRQDTEDANWLLSQQHEGPSKYSSFDPWSIITTAAADPDFRFHVTAAWADVQRKAKRIRAEGGVRVTAASDGMIHGEVKGDHHVYETGLQRLPGRVAVASWSCGCKWGAYHWGADDDFSRFAGRMCSHALALQYEAQSRGMFGREVVPDAKAPSWVPRKVVVKYDIDADTNRLAPSTSVAASLVRHALKQGEDPMEVALAFQAGGLSYEAAVNDAWGEPTPAAPQYGPGPTKPRDINENPASAGWAASPDPQAWSEQGPSGLSHMVSSLQDDEALFEPEMGKEAVAPLVVPLVRAVAPAVVRAVAPGLAEKAVDKAVHHHDQNPAAAGPEQAFDDDEDNPLNYGARAMLNEAPEPALPSTDAADVDLMSPDSLEPDSLGFASTGSVNDIVAQFQATAGAQALQGGGSAPGGGGDGLDVAAAAREYLAKTALKDFTPAEQAQIINEGENVRAANLDRLDIAGTHYEPLEAALAAVEGDDDEGWMA